MKRKILSVIITIASITLLVTAAVRAEIPAPPVNQQLGMDDGVFNNLAEADCRFCHEDPNIVSGGTDLPQRHDSLAGTAIRTGECSVNRTTCLADNDCNAALCSRNNLPCSFDSECPDFTSGETCGEICTGETVVPDIDSDDNGTNDTLYDCLNCHDSPDPQPIEVERDCTVCHIQVPGEGSVHHLLPAAQGGDCTPCHGTLVDDIGDGHTVPAYTPSLVTPSPGGGGLPGNGGSYCSGSGAACVTAVDCMAGTCSSIGSEPCNVDGDCPPAETCIGGSGLEESCSAGGCTSCHDSGTDSATGVQVFTNNETHHNTGVFRSETGVMNFNACQWCHNMSLPDDYVIRTCEGCHGLEALHSIQGDSPNPANMGTIVVGGEDAGYGHVGRDAGPGDSDCLGCHGFALSSEPGPGGTPGHHVSYGDQTEADCRLCHEADPVYLPDRHHLLYDQSIPAGSLVPFPDANGDGNQETNYRCLNCHGAGIALARDCRSCHQTVRDTDGDGIPNGDGSTPCTGGNTVDCDDNCVSIPNPDQADRDNDGMGDDCDACTDIDGDGYAVEGGGCGAIDCNDSDQSINPGESEVWYDGIDRNCDGWNDYDQDGDTYVHAEWFSEAGGTSPNTNDCDDTDPAVNLGGPPVRVMGQQDWIYYGTIQEAYGDPSGLGAMQIRAYTSIEDLIFDGDKSVVIESGYDCSHSSITGTTVLYGNMTLSDGTVTITVGKFELK